MTVNTVTRLVIKNIDEYCTSSLSIFFLSLLTRRDRSLEVERCETHIPYVQQDISAFHSVNYDNVNSTTATNKYVISI